MRRTLRPSNQSSPSSSSRLQQTFKLFTAATLALYIAVALLTVFVYSLSVREADRAAGLAEKFCVDTRTLITDVVLRSVNNTYEDYVRDPAMVLDSYRRYLHSFEALSEENIEASVERTQGILVLADPARCEH